VDTNGLQTNNKDTLKSWRCYDREDWQNWRGRVMAKSPHLHGVIFVAAGSETPWPCPFWLFLGEGQSDLLTYRTSCSTLSITCQGGDDAASKQRFFTYDAHVRNTKNIQFYPLYETITKNKPNLKQFLNLTLF
jgi:hypothetical protein